MSHLIPADAALFYSRNDRTDMRLGDIVTPSLTTETKLVLMGFGEERGVARNRGRTGQAAAPDRVRRALYKLPASHFELNRELGVGALADLGNVDLGVHTGHSLEDAHDRLTQIVADLVSKNVLVVVIGGGHDLAFATGCGLRQVYSRTGLVNFDAHLDLRPVLTERNSGTPFYQLVERFPNLAAHFVEVGIQPNANALAHYRYAKERGISVVPLSELRERGMEAVIRKTLETVTTDTDALQCSIDIDGVRMSDAPASSAPQVIGLAAEEVIYAVENLAALPALKLIDLAEYNPLFDRDDQTARLLALLIWTALMRR